MLTKNIMKKHDNCVLEATKVTLRGLAEAINRGKEGAVFLIDKKQVLKGIVTDGDIGRYIVKKQNSVNNIFNIINFNPISISVKGDAAFALRLMRENSINVLPVVDNKKRIVGIIGLHDLIPLFSPERLYIKYHSPDLIDKNVEKHISRYRLASNFVEKNAIVLDCACGSGYGTAILSEKAKKVFGVDLSEEAIKFANRHNMKSNIKYLCKNLDNLSFKNSLFGAIISYETLEHLSLKSFLKFIDNVSKWLKSGGVFVASSPMLRFKNKKPYITSAYHINEMPKNELINIFYDKLKNFTIQFFHQKQDSFLPLTYENTGFCIVIARKGKFEL